MSRLIFLALILITTSCLYPKYTRWNKGQFNTRYHLEHTDTLLVRRFHFSSIQRNSRSFRPPYDTLELSIDMGAMLIPSMTGAPVYTDTLINDPKLAPLSNVNFRYKRMKRFLKEREEHEDVIVPIINYQVLFGREREAGGVGFSSDTGNDQYIIAQEVYVAVYQNSKLVYLNNGIRLDEKIVPAGTPITHEFPQEVLDTLMHMALEPLLRQMEKSR